METRNTFVNLAIALGFVTFLTTSSTSEALASRLAGSAQAILSAGHVQPKIAQKASCSTDSSATIVPSGLPGFALLKMGTTSKGWFNANEVKAFYAVAKALLLNAFSPRSTSMMTATTSARHRKMSHTVWLKPWAPRSWKASRS